MSEFNIGKFAGAATSGLMGLAEAAMSARLVGSGSFMQIRYEVSLVS
jgi:hypothetical protein